MNRADAGKFGERCFTHDIEALVSLANVKARRGLDIQANPQREVNWEAVKQRNVDVRCREIDETEARKLFKAVADPADGVLAWIRTVW